MYNKLENIIKESKGNVLTIGLDDKLMNCFSKNNNVNLYAINSNDQKNFKKSKKRKTNKGKNINIKKLRKYINKKSVDYLICNMNEMINYYKYFIKDSIFLSNNMIYIYFDNKIDLEFIIDRYERYNVEIKYDKYKTGYLLTINANKAKSNGFKDILYIIKDTFYNIAEFIGNVLVS